MMAELIDRKQLKADTRELLKTAEVSPWRMTALYMGLLLLLNTVDTLAGQGTGTVQSLPGLFVSILTALLGMVLGAGFVLYCMTIRRGERAEYLTLFDGFSFVGKLIALLFVEFFFVFLWSMLLFFPGIIAIYRYRFAEYNLYENPGIGVMEALEMSKRQTLGYKAQLFVLDWSYFGWALLATFPLTLVSSFMVQETLYQGSAALLPIYPKRMIVWVLLASAWSYGVSIFFRPHFQCVELGYFEIAKRTSGVGLNSEPPRPEGSPGGWTDGWGQT